MELLSNVAMTEVMTHDEMNLLERQEMSLTRADLAVWTHEENPV
jgi:hypothetical protein